MGSPTSAVTPPTPAASGPAAAVEAFFNAINSKDYATAWRLGGRNSGPATYQDFVQGFSGTARDTVTILSVSGNVVTAGLAAQQADGSIKMYQGTYTVVDGVIAKFNVQQAN
jgi:hypothetical protein